ncbi:hypothetical protein [Actinomyces succiniciruminis]|uniref:Uncharacterized protein n=1 Tax=Actinomyces succiniciruminis TaxID=1522002 RepID=A0A1L7RAI3_9ACTO|nr:hypothetical protein [Actinomyces succiniciruminis]CED90841.1 Hypothetical protein AAM4_1009 [Actinomyces succiniciruminis]
MTGIRQGGAESLVRRPSPFTYVFGGFFALLGVMFLIIGSRLLAFGVSVPPFAVAGVAGAAVLMIGGGLAPPLRFRTVFDATGIHSRGVLRTVHLPWPASRTAFVINVSERVRSENGGTTDVLTATVAVATPDGNVTLAAPRIAAMNPDGLRSRLEAEVDEIWAWARSRGYVREFEAAPDGPIPLAPTPRYDGPAPASAPADGLSPEDRALLSRDPLIFKPAGSAIRPAIILCVVYLALAGGMRLLTDLGPRHIPALGGRFPESGAFAGVSAALLISVLGYLLFSVFKTMRTRLTLVPEGLVWQDVWRTERLTWPPSRSCIFVLAFHESVRTTASLRLLAPDGVALRIPGLHWASRDERRALLAAEAMAQAIWEWGASSGAARDDGVYRPAADAEVEQRRVATAQRIEYLRTFPQEQR